MNRKIIACGAAAFALAGGVALAQTTGQQGATGTRTAQDQQNMSQSSQGAMGQSQGSMGQSQGAMGQGDYGTMRAGERG